MFITESHTFVKLLLFDLKMSVWLVSFTSLSEMIVIVATERDGAKNNIGNTNQYFFLLSTGSFYPVSTAHISVSPLSSDNTPIPRRP